MTEPYKDRPNTPEEDAENARHKDFFDEHPEFGSTTHFACRHRRDGLDCEICYQVNKPKEDAPWVGCLAVLISMGIVIGAVAAAAGWI